MLQLQITEASNSIHYRDTRNAVLPTTACTIRCNTYCQGLRNEKPMRKQSSGDGLRRVVRNLNSLKPHRESINTGEQEEKPVGRWKGSDDVYMHFRKTSVRWYKMINRSKCVSLHFGSLTLPTHSRTNIELSIHVWPHETTSHEILDCSNTGMREEMEHRKHLL